MDRAREWDLLFFLKIHFLKSKFKSQKKVLNDRAWICGGEEHMKMARAGRPVSSCHSFSFKDGWRDEARMPDPIINHALVAYPKTNSLFIIGGRYNHRDWSTVRFLKTDEVNARWQNGANLPERVREVTSYSLQK